MNLSPRNKLIATAAAAAIVVIVLAVALVVPQFGKLGEVRGEIDRAIQDSESATTLLEQRRQVRSEAAVTDAKLLQLAVAIPENPDLPSLIIDLQDTAYDSGVVIMNVQTAGPEFTKDAAFAALPVTLEVWGTWSDTVDYLQRLQNTERELRDNGFTCEVLPAAKEDNKSGLTFPPYYQVRSTVRLRAYVIPSNESTGTSSAVPTPAQ